MQSQEPTNRDLLEAIQTLTHRQDKTDQKTDDILEAISDFATHIETRMATMETSMATKADLERFATKADLERIVTKEYLDDKLANLRGDLILLARKQNRKFETFVEDLAQDGKISHVMADRILSMQPFPKLTAELLKQ